MLLRISSFTTTPESPSTDDKAENEEETTHKVAHSSLLISTLVYMAKLSREAATAAITNDTNATTIDEEENFRSSSADSMNESNSIFLMLAVSMPNPISSSPMSEGRDNSSVPNGINANNHNTQSFKSPWTKIPSAYSVKQDVAPSIKISDGNGNSSHPNSIGAMNPGILSLQNNPNQKIVIIDTNRRR